MTTRTSPPEFCLRIRVPVKAPSINHLYSRAGPKVFLSKKGKEFKGLLTAAVVRETQTLPWPEAIKEVYHHKATIKLTVFVYVTRYINNSWKPGRITTGKKTGKKTLQSPYQKVDVTNFAKIIEDGISQGTGIDDSLHHDVRYVLRGGSSPKIAIIYRVVKHHEAKNSLG